MSALESNMADLRSKIVRAEADGLNLCSECTRIEQMFESKLDACVSLQRETSASCTDAQTQLKAFEQDIEGYNRNQKRVSDALSGRMQLTESQLTDLTKKLNSSLLKAEQDVSTYCKATALDRINEKFQQIEDAEHKQEGQRDEKLVQFKSACDEAIKMALNDANNRTVKETTSLDSRMNSTLQQGIQRLEQKLSEQQTKLAAMIQTETTKVRRDVEPKRGRSDADLSERIKVDVSRLSSRIETLELKTRNQFTEKQLEERCSAIESVLVTKIRDFEGNQGARMQMLVEDMTRVNADTTREVDSLNRKVDGTDSMIRERLKSTEDLLTQQTENSITRLDKTCDATRDDLSTKLLSMGETMIHKFAELKDANQLASVQHDGDMKKFKDDAHNITLLKLDALREDVEAKATELCDKVNSELGSLKEHLVGELGICQNKVLNTDADLSKRITGEVTKMRHDFSAANTGLESKLSQALKDCVSKMDGKADMNYVKTVDSLIRDEINLVTEACTMLSESLDEQVRMI